MKLKQMLCSVLVSSMFFASSVSVFAGESKELPSNVAVFVSESRVSPEIGLGDIHDNSITSTFTVYELEKHAEKLHVSVDELINFEQNFMTALSELNTATRSQRALNQNEPITVATLTSAVVFNFSNGRVSVEDASTSHSGFLWSLESGNEAKSSGAGSSAWARNGFSGEFNVGIHPIEITIQSFQFNNTITAQANDLSRASTFWN